MLMSAPCSSRSDASRGSRDVRQGSTVGIRANSEASWRRSPSRATFVVNDRPLEIVAVVALVSLTVFFATAGVACSPRRSTDDVNGSTVPSQRMLDGKRWMTENLNVPVPDSYCYGNAEATCGEYGRLYTWDSARRACESLGRGWRLPTNDDWRRMAKDYGGIRDDSTDGGKAAYTSLMSGGSSGFSAVLGGGRGVDGEYARLDAHGFYWTSTTTGSTRAWFYNFGKGSQFLNRHDDGEKARAFSVRCVRG